MALDFGKLEFGVSFDPQFAFPLDARSYFESLSAAQEAAAAAVEAGKKDSVYYYGQTLAVVEHGVATLYIIQPDNSLQAVGKIDSDLFEYDEFGNLTLQGLDEAPVGSVPTKTNSGGLDWIVPVDAYSKEETNLKISEAVAAAPHLKRKVVETIDDINVNAADADQYIYMVSTDSEGPNKYDEYIVMVVVDDDNIETRFVEQVGSWDIDLSDYATVDALDTKVDKKENYDLVPTEEIVKLLTVAKGAESNIINSVSSNFKIDELNNRQLQLNSVPVEKVVGLDELLALKIDKEEGHSLVSPDDRRKLEALDIDGDNNLIISGTVNAYSVQDLNTWITRHSDGTDEFVPGLSKHNLTDDLYNKLMSAIRINSVRSGELAVTEDTHELYVVKIDSEKVTGLQDALNKKASELAVQELTTRVNNIEVTLNNYVSKNDYEKDLGEIRDILTWKNIDE